jgi:uncharacterized protein (DUF2252 family)
MASIMVAARVTGPGNVARALCGGFLASYARALQGGRADSVGRDPAKGLIGRLLEAARERTRAELLDSRTEIRNQERRLRIDGKKALPADKKQRVHVEKVMDEFASHQENPKFFRLLDVARRIAGTGSLGVERYVLLVEGKGSRDGNYLLDLKRARPSVLMPHVQARQPGWNSEADRVVSVQRRMQAVPPAFLHSVEMNGDPFVLRGLQPSEDRLDLAHANGKRSGLQAIVAEMGKIVAWDQLRSSGWRGSASADELIEFGRTVGTSPTALIELAENFAVRVEADWRAFHAHSATREERGKTRAHSYAPGGV